MAAPVFDAASTANALAVTSLSWSHTASGADRLVLVGVSWRATNVTVSSVTYGGAAMTSVGSKFHSAGASAHMHLFRLIAPPTEAQTVVVTMSAATDALVAGAVSMTGVHQTTPLGTFASAEGSSPSNPATVDVTSATDELVIDTVASHGFAGTLTAGGGQTQRWNSGPVDVVIGAGSTEPGAATITMSWTLATLTNWVIGAVSVKPAAAGGIPTLVGRRFSLAGPRGLAG